MHTLFSDVYFHQSIGPDAYSAGANAGSGVNIGGYNKALCVMNVGDIVTTGSVVMTVEHCATDTSSDYAVVSSDYIEPSVSVDSDTDNEIYLMDLDLRKAEISSGYIRLVLTASDAGADMGGMILLYGGTRRVPVDQQNTVIKS